MSKKFHARTFHAAHWQNSTVIRLSVPKEIFVANAVVLCQAKFLATSSHVAVVNVFVVCGHGIGKEAIV
jgi:hypothetical protein